MLPEDQVLRALRGRRQGAVMAYVGPAGIGKTHSAQALLRRGAVPGAVLPASLPLSEWPARLPRPRRLAAWVEAALEHGPEGGPLPALAALLAALAPFCLLVEDLHDATPEKRSALLALARLVGRARGVALVFTSRQPLPEELPTQLVGALSGAQTAALAASELGAGLPDEALGWVGARALGNPLFTLEYLRYLVRSGHLYSDGQRWHWRAPEGGRVPSRLEALVSQTLGRAGGQRALLEARAVVPDAPWAVWAAVADLRPEGLSAGAESLRSLGLLSGPDFHFHHPLYAEVLQAELDPARRALLSGRALAAYRDDPLRAVPFAEAARLPKDETLALLEGAAAQAERLGQPGQAGALLARASDLEGGPAHTEMALRAARLLQSTDLPRALEQALRALNDPALAPQALPIAATLSARTGGRAALDALLARTPTDLPRQTAAIVALQGSGDHAGVLALWDGLDAGAQARADSATQQAVTTSLLAMGRGEEAAARLEAALAGPLTEAERLNLQAVRVLLLYHQGRYREAADLASATAAGLEAAGNPARASALRHNGAAFRRMLGEFDTAMPELRLALEARRALGDVRGYASSLGLLGELELERAQFEAAEDALGEALGVLNYLDNSHFLLNNLSMLTTLYTLSDTPLSVSLTLHHAGRALETARALANPRLLVETLTDASRAYTRAGQAGRALELVLDATQLSHSLDTDGRTHARLALARGLALEGLGRPQEALTALTEAEHIARRAQGDYEADKIAVEVARLRGDRATLTRLAGHFEARGQGLGALLAGRALGHTGTAELAPRLCLLGPLTLDGQPVRGERRRALLLHLLEARLTGRAEVGRLDLTDELYPGRPEPQALGALKQTVAALRADLGSELVLTTPGGYTLGTVHSDAEAFLARPDLAAWRGPLPTEAGEALREALHRALRQALADQLEARPEAAARAGRLLLDSDPLDEEALHLTLTALRRVDNHRSLTRLYERARAAHAELGTQLPARWQAYLAQA